MLHADFLLALEHAPHVDTHVLAIQLRGCVDAFRARRWVTSEGHLTSILAPVLGSEEEVEVTIDEDKGTFSYQSPGTRGRTVTRPLTEIALYAFNLENWFEELGAIFGIEPSQRARRPELIKGHLWHLGNIRVSGTHQFAPIYVARCLEHCQQNWIAVLSDPIRPGLGLVLTARRSELRLPNSHQAQEIEDLLLEDGTRATCRREVLDRLLRLGPADEQRENEWFDVHSGALFLPHMDTPKTFVGNQKAAIALFWKERNGPALKWSEVVARANCGRDPDSVFGKGVWREWLENTSYGRYRMRTRQAVTS